MRRTFVVLGLILAVIAIIFSTLPLSNIAFIPAILAFAIGLMAYRISKKTKTSKNNIQLIFWLAFISLSIATYKAIFNTNEVGDTKELDKKEQASENEAIEELEGLDIGE